MRSIRLNGAALLLFLFGTAVAQELASWQDPSPHTVRLVEVEKGVQLEVLDWGGSGSPLVLLPGLGATAHQFDDLAQVLTKRHRVIGMTRRGHRGSSAATSGYDFPRLAQDVILVLEAMAIDNPVVIGHSFAGEELHVLGTRYDSRIRGLVYVDAAFNQSENADMKAYNDVARAVPGAPPPAPVDMASFASLRAYLDKYGGAGPEGHVRTRYRVKDDGTIGGMWSPDPPVMQAMTRTMQEAYKAYNPAKVPIPALAIYAMPKSADDMLRRGSSNRLPFPELLTRAMEDSALRVRIEKLYQLTRERFTNHEKWFLTLAERGRVTELSGTHDLITSNPRELVDLIEGFVSSLPAKQ